MNEINEEHYSMVEDCTARESRLSEWEAGFIESITEALHNGKSLTERQEEILNSIWEKVTQKG
jgi:hypothetical protein